MFRALAREYYAEMGATGRNPLTVLVDLAFDDTLDVETRMTAANMACPYLNPRLSSQVIQSTSISAQVDHSQVMDALTARLDRLIAPAPVLTITATDEPT